MSTPATARLLLEALSAPWHFENDSPSARTEAFRRALLNYGSETEDNLAAAQRVALEADTAPHGSLPAGLAATVGTRGVQIADVLSAAEGCPIPEQVADSLPELTQEEWDAVLRLATLVFTGAATATIPD